MKLFKQLGSKPHPRTDKFIDSDIAQPNNDGYQWNTGSTGVHTGKVYARRRVDGCKADNSRRQIQRAAPDGRSGASVDAGRRAAGGCRFAASDARRLRALSSAW